MKIENLEPFNFILDDTVLVTSITYSWDRIIIKGINAGGRTKEQILRDEGWLRDVD